MLYKVLKKFGCIRFIYRIIFCFVLFNFIGTKASELEKYLPAYAVAVNSDILTNSTCKTELEILRVGIDQKILWSLKVLDASGEPRSGFVYGNNFWSGSKSQCLDLENTKPLQLDPDILKNNSKYRNINEEFPPYHLNYFVAFFYHNSTLQYQLRFKYDCMTWSWYLSSDMQFYIIGTFLLLLSDIYFYASVILLMSLLIVPAIIDGFISYAHSYTATVDQMLMQMHVIYSPPWMRIGSYLIGIIAAYILIKLKGKLNVSRKTLCLLWIIGGSCNISTLFGLYGKNLSLVSAGIYVALSKITWSMGIAWILIACQTNSAGLVNKILSLKLWIPLSKLTYCAYLLNPLITLSIAMSSESPIHLDFLPIGTYFLGLTVSTFLAAFIASIVFELPYSSLFQIISKQRKQYE